MRISDWSSDVCSSDLAARALQFAHGRRFPAAQIGGLHDRHPRARGRGAGVRSPLSVAVDRPRPVPPLEIGSASCRDRVCPYVLLSVFAVSLTKQATNQHTTPLSTHYFTNSPLN